MDQPLRYKEVTSLGEVCQTIKMDSNGFVGCGRCVVCSGVMDLHMASKTLNPMDLRLAYMLYHVLSSNSIYMECTFSFATSRSQKF